MTKDEIKEIAVSVVKKLEEEGSDIIPYYLVLYVVTSALAKTGTEFPIDGIDPITMSFLREIKRINPELSGFDVNEVRIAIYRYLKENNYASQYLNVEV